MHMDTVQCMSHTQIFMHDFFWSVLSIENASKFRARHAYFRLSMCLHRHRMQFFPVFASTATTSPYIVIFYLNFSTAFPYNDFFPLSSYSHCDGDGVVYLSTFIRSLFKYVSIGHESLDFTGFFFSITFILCVYSFTANNIFI